MIVDDEKLLRQGFVHMTDWEKDGFTITGQAANGKEALAMVEEAHPDIIVTDIRMPVMDGIELTRIVKDKYPEIEVIVLSSFDDFDYVRETLKQGAMDYLLKTNMNYSDILGVLSKAKRQIRQRHANELSKQRGQLKAIHALFDENVETELSFDEVFDDLGVSLMDTNLQLVLLKVTAREQQLDEQLLSSMASQFSEEMSKHYTTFAFASQQQTIVALLNCNHLRTFEMKHTMRGVIQQLLNDYELDVWGFISDPFDGFDAIHQTYQYVLDQARHAFYLDKNQVYSMNQLSALTHAPLDYDHQRLGQLIKQLDFDLLKREVSAGISEMIRTTGYPEPAKMRLFLIEILNIVILKVQEEGFHLPEIRESKGLFIEQIQHLQTFAEVEQLLCDTIDLIAEQVFQLREENFGTTLSSIIQYMNQNYDQRITLSSVAQHFHVNKSYLAQLFRQRKNETFNEYLNQIRMDQAKRLLRFSELSISSICEQVGFANPSYFSKIFKESVGMTPSDYQNIHRKL